MGAPVEPGLRTADPLCRPHAGLEDVLEGDRRGATAEARARGAFFLLRLLPAAGIVGPQGRHEDGPDGRPRYAVRADPRAAGGLSQADPVRRALAVASGGGVPSVR